MYLGIQTKPSCICVMLRAASLLIILLVNLVDARDMAIERLSKLSSGLYTGAYLDGGPGPINITTQLGTHAYLPCRVKQLVDARDMAIERLSKLSSGLYTGAYLDGGPGPINITTQLGTHAYLPCRVKQLGNNKSVSWIRRRDAHILTVDRYTFIADERFQSFLIETTGTWTLQVKYVQQRDAGSYECQVSGSSESDRKMSSIVNLHVVVPHTEILGESDVYVRVGSTVALRCLVRDAMIAPPSYINWYHGGVRILQTYGDKYTPWAASMERTPDDSTIGILRIESAQREHSGNYTCHPSNLAPARVTLHVLDGEHPAAMQRDINSAVSISQLEHLFNVFLSIAIVLMLSIH
ncbi:lachesin-like [Ctenocephalides felis]|uniref:lachesin-like n=1 Tax=Ctenocephalides felis TaxID=7515 RepID=UPI000E6E4407|nr:lachesin-like [Ctenocephalides felis]